MSTLFIVDGNPPCALAEFLAANADDPEVCEWARTARPGDRFPALVECVVVASHSYTMLQAAQAIHDAADTLHPLLSAGGDLAQALRDALDKARRAADDLQQAATDLAAD